MKENIKKLERGKRYTIEMFQSSNRMAHLLDENEKPIGIIKIEIV